MYSVLSFGRMAADGVRMDVYARAIQRAVKPGSIVVDIGAGTGIFSLLAARAGARKVHAVDPNPAVWLAADLARENGLGDRIEVHATTSYELELTEKADVIISDLRGSVSPHEQHFQVLRDAKKRLLAAGGTLIPQRDELLVGLFESDDFMREVTRGTVGFERRGLTANAARTSIVNTQTFDGANLRTSDLLTDGARWGSVVYGTDDATLEGTVDLELRRGGTVHGLAVWFEATILDDLRFSTAPGAAMVYARVVLPLVEPVNVDANDRATVVVRTDEAGSRWAWETEIKTAAGVTKARFRQASFYGMPTSPSALLRLGSRYAATLSDRGARAKRILELIDGGRTVAAIADEVHASMGATSIPVAAILEEVRDLVERYAR